MELDELRRWLMSEDVRSLYDEDEVIPATIVWRVDLTEARFRTDVEGRTIELLSGLPPDSLSVVEEVVPQRPARE